MGSARIALDGALNFRDLGGYTTGRGTTARGKLYRSDALSELTARDVAFLTDLGAQNSCRLAPPAYSAGLAR